MATSEQNAIPPNDAQGAGAPRKAGALRPSRVLTGKTARVILVAALLMVIPLFIPALAKKLALKDQTYNSMLPSPGDLISFNGSTRRPGAGDLPGSGESEGGAPPPPAPNPTDKDIQDPSGSLAPFYAALARTEAKQPGAITRISHYGDSPITNDVITGTVRHALQVQYGDSGHGFILIGRPWESYVHQSISFSGSDWDNDHLMAPKGGRGLFGFGGVSFTANGPGKSVKYGPAPDGDTGKNFAHIDVYFLKQSNGGDFGVSVNGGDPQTVSTQGPDDESGFAEVKAPGPGPNTFEIRSGNGPIRLFGAVLENDDPGVTYDSLGIIGAYAGLLATTMNEQHWAAQLQHRKPNLVIINYGTNESQYASDEQMAVYDRNLREVIRRIRAAVPDAAILIMSPMDRGKRQGGQIITHPAIPKIVAMQQNVALSTGCAFFNMYQAMGGDGTMARWYASKPRLVSEDLIHPSGAGGVIVGNLIRDALLNGFAVYKQQHPAPAPSK